MRPRLGPLSLGRQFVGGTDPASIRVPPCPGFSTTRWTVALWSNRGGVGSPSSLGRWLDRTGGSGHFLWYIWDASNVAFEAQWSGGSANWRWPIANTDTPVHELVRYDGATPAGDPEVWRNGEPLTVTEHIAPSGSLTPDPGTSLYIGNRADGTRRIHARIADVAWWNRLLTEDEIRRVYRTSPLAAPAGLVLYLPIGGASSIEPAVVGPSGHVTVAGSRVSATQMPVRPRPVEAWNALSGQILSVGGGVTPSGALDLRPDLAFGGGIAPTGAIGLRPDLTFGGDIAPTGLLALQAALAFGGGITPVGGLGMQLPVSFGGGITPSGTVTHELVTPPAPGSGDDIVPLLRRRARYRPRIR